MIYTNVCKHCLKQYRSRIKSFSCDQCKNKDEDYFDKIVGYLKKYPNSNALQISDALGISAYQVLNYLKEGRLNYARGHFEQIGEAEEGSTGL